MYWKIRSIVTVLLMIKKIIEQNLGGSKKNSNPILVFQISKVSNLRSRIWGLGGFNVFSPSWSISIAQNPGFRGSKAHIARFLSAQSRIFCNQYRKDDVQISDLKFEVWRVQCFLTVLIYINRTKSRISRIKSSHCKFSIRAIPDLLPRVSNWLVRKYEKNWY